MQRDVQVLEVVHEPSKVILLVVLISPVSPPVGKLSAQSVIERLMINTTRTEVAPIIRLTLQPDVALCWILLAAGGDSNVSLEDATLIWIGRYFVV